MSDGEKLPDYFDVIVLGSGLPESIIASACSRSGLTVLHLDRNEYYGGKYASFNFHGIKEWAADIQASSTTTLAFDQQLLKNNEEVIALDSRTGIYDVHTNWNLTETSGESCNSEMSEEMENKWREFNIDLLPKILPSKGEMVDVLCSSTASNYCPFKHVDRFLYCANTEDVLSKGTAPEFDVVPYTRMEIFVTSKLTPLEKRRGMQFFSLFKDTNGKLEDNPIYKEYAEQPFELFLARQSISGKLKDYITDTIGILQTDTTTAAGVKAVRRFLESLGRFSNSPFLWPLYGSGELPQCFCRLCAVFGGIYCLKRSVDGLVLNEGRVTAVITEGQRINCQYVIADACYLPQCFLSSTDGEKILRVIVITKQSLLSDNEERLEHISLLNLKRFDPETSPWLLEVGREGCVAPKNYVVSHITASGKVDTLRLVNLARKLYKCKSEVDDTDNRPLILWSLAYSISSPEVCSAKLPSNLRATPGPSASLDYSSVVQQARAIFQELWSDRDFLPPVLKVDEDLEGETIADIVPEPEEVEDPVKDVSDDSAKEPPTIPENDPAKEVSDS